MLNFLDLFILSFIISFFYLVTPNLSIASQEYFRPTITTSVSEPSSSSSPWTLFGGIAGGYSRIYSSSYSESPQGAQYLLNLDLSFQAQHWIIDAGIGWMNSSVAGKTSVSQEASIQTLAGLLELNPRYRINNRWQIGPVVNLAFGTDTTYAPTQGLSTNSVLIGLKGIYEIPSEAYPIRFWTQLSTNTFSREQQAYVAWLGIQVGIPIKIGGSHSKEASSSPKATASNRLSIILDPQRVFFGTSSADMDPDMQSILEDLGKYLDSNEASANTEILGYADQRGSFNYNLKLSQKRAEAVKNGFIKGGLNAAKLELKALSYLHPIDPKNNPSAWAKNRRVEIVFNSIRNPGALIEKLKPLSGEIKIKSDSTSD